MVQILTATQPTGETFSSNASFIVTLDIYADGWFLEYAVDDKTVTDKSTLNWKKYHSQPLQQHGELSRVTVYGIRPEMGSAGFLYRMNSGTQGATAFREILM